MNLSQDQEIAFEKIKDWLATKPTGFFKLFGYAGTGKTTLARHVADLVGDGAVFACYTGKGAQVLSRKIGRRATTVHRLIYRFDGRDKKGRPIFRDLSLEEGSLGSADLVIVDECSMITQPILNDIMRWETPVLALGDPGQLPPVNGLPFFRDDPDALLETIHRQAEGNEIIECATRVREGRDHHGFDDDVRFIRAADIPDDEIVNAGQILVGLKNTRRRVNAYARTLLGYDKTALCANERIVCLRNNHELGIYNGEVFRVVDAEIMRNKIAAIIMDDLGETKTVVIDPDVLRSGEPNFHSEMNLFDYGYALTVHKAQGSEWQNTLLIDDRLMAHDHAFRRQWLYTGITRASHKLVIAE